MIEQETSTERIAELRAMPYQDYLRTQEWTARRAVKLDIAEYRCQLCNAREGLQVHHRDYSRLGCEKMEDLLVLCKDCHKLFHERRTLTKGDRATDESIRHGCDWQSIGSGYCSTPRKPHYVELRTIHITWVWKTCGNCKQRIQPGDYFVEAWPPGSKGTKPHCTTCCPIREVHRVNKDINIDQSKLGWKEQKQLYHPGDRVRHKLFGEGIILKSEMVFGEELVVAKFQGLDHPFRGYVGATEKLS